MVYRLRECHFFLSLSLYDCQEKANEREKADKKAVKLPGLLDEFSFVLLLVGAGELLLIVAELRGEING